jgi:hypothetical protein
VIDTLRERLSESVDHSIRCCVAYIYCDYRDEVQQTATNMITAILTQMITDSYYVSDDVLQALKKHEKQKIKPDLEEACRWLKLCLQSFERVYLCIDALDECMEEQRGYFLGSISDVLNHGSNSIRVFVTGRLPIQRLIEYSLPVVPHAVRLEANEEDIRQYISCQFEMDEKRGDMDESFKEEIMEKIVETADGM